jgi:FtsH-binding integral membrane protein
MANWSDPRPNGATFATAAGARTEAYDAGLRSYMLSVYNYMTSAILLTGIVALGFAMSGMAAQVFMGGGILRDACPRRRCRRCSGVSRS